MLGELLFFEPLLTVATSKDFEASGLCRLDRLEWLEGQLALVSDQKRVEVAQLALETHPKAQNQDLAKHFVALFVAPWPVAQALEYLQESHPLLTPTMFG